jgi:predicted short-subunit dehydrogenase-like oxidoreductase (DUF2520 family)
VKIAIVGRGRVGRGLSRALTGRGVEHRLLDSRKRLHTGGASTIVVAVSDGAIITVASRLAPHLRPGAVVLHVAGSLGPSALSFCAEAGAAVGVMHPLVSFPTPGTEVELDGTTFVIDGHRRAIAAARRLAESIGAVALVAQIHGPAYHAAAALLANGSAALATVSVTLLGRLGVDVDDAELAMAGLLRSVASNVERIGVPAALTGPIVRGDAATVRGHRAALRRHKSALAAYEAVGPIIVDVARKAGLRGAAAAAVQKALTKKMRG